MIRKVIEDVGVDAGLIMIADREYFEQRHPKYLDEKLSKIIEVPISKYKVTWTIPNTWHGNVSGNGVLDVTSGKVVVSDPCYILQHENVPQLWDKWLLETDYGVNPPNGTLILDKMGGDGVYTVYLELESQQDTNS
jgi:hypothetical protein